LEANEFKWNGASTSSGSESTSPVSSFLPNLVRRLSGRVNNNASSASSDAGNRLQRKRRAPPSPSAHYIPLSPSLSNSSNRPLSPSISERGFNLFRPTTREESVEVILRPQRPVNRRSFSLPLLMLPKRQRSDRLAKHPSGGSSGHEADISQEDSVNDEDIDDRRRSFEVTSRPAVKKTNQVAQGLALIDEKEMVNKSPSRSPLSVRPVGRGRINSSPVKPSAMEVFDLSPSKDDLMMARRHSLTQTPALSPYRIQRDPNSASSLDTLLTTPSPTKHRSASSPITPCLLPLAAAGSQPSLHGSEEEEEDQVSFISSKMDRTPHSSTQSTQSRRIDKDLFDDDTCGLSAGKIKVYGEEFMLGGRSI